MNGLCVQEVTQYSGQHQRRCATSVGQTAQHLVQMRFKLGSANALVPWVDIVAPGTDERDPYPPSCVTPSLCYDLHCCSLPAHSPWSLSALWICPGTPSLTIWVPDAIFYGPDGMAAQPPPPVEGPKGNSYCAATLHGWLAGWHARWSRRAALQLHCSCQLPPPPPVASQQQQVRLAKTPT